MGRNSVADDVKVVAHLSNGNSFDCQILAFGFHYYIAALKIQSESDAPLPTACLAHLDDSISVDPNQLYIPEEKPFQLCPHSKSFNLIPGDTLIALGRYFIKPYDVMATIGEFSLNRCEYDCKELLRVNCQITREWSAQMTIDYSSTQDHVILHCYISKHLIGPKSCGMIHKRLV
ncbi:hypothetical protein MANES_04G051500v8 [Manihot esculenta]|uniref:Uncharacterized protein n=1 Tax=Manihot esculenta TaxID=3983 RepID=A0ACB7HSG2_MANES|nr:hypothetical protein MANES_04G051500v8 [Manihot esculenta]